MSKICIFFAIWNCISIVVHTSNEARLKLFETCLTLSGTCANNIVSRGSGYKYEKLNWQWNALNGHVYPMAYVIVADVSDVQNAVICSKASNVRIVPRGGGHSYLKYGFGDSESVVIDMSNLNQVVPHPEQMTCEIGAGARGGLVKYTLWENGFMIMAGRNPAVGLVGLTLGGGYGDFDRTYGLACDNLIELEMVDSNGKLLVINDHENEDLFWALRGGGGGNFGIVTKMKSKMYRAPKTIVHGSFKFDQRQFPQFYFAWQSLMASKNVEHINGFVTLEDVIDLHIYHPSPEQKTGNMSGIMIENLLDVFHFPNERNGSIVIQTYEEFLLVVAQIQFKTRIHNLSQLRDIDEYVGWKRIKSFYVDTMLSRKEIQELHELSKPFLKVCIWHFEMNGGAINAFNNTDTAFVHRDKNMFHVQLKFIDGNADHRNLKGELELKTFFEKTKLLLNHRESYQNYMDEDMTDYLERYYGVNLKRLIEIKMKVDPENIFRYPRSIPNHN